MEYITIKHTDLNVSRLCVGGCPMGGYGWGNVQEEELIEAVHTALDKGINFFDTADTYGLGQSEKTLAKALENHREEVVIASKFGVRVANGVTTYDNSESWIEEALDASLKRLNTDYIDLYQVHYRDKVTPISTVVEALEKQRKKGKIRYYGLSNIYQEDVEELRQYQGRFVSFQDEYSLACRKNEKDILRISEEMEMTPLTWGSLGQGILTGKYDANIVFESNDRRSREIYVNFHGEKLLKNLQIVEELKKIATYRGKDAASVAIRYILDYLPQSIVICGVKKAEQVVSNLKGLNWNLEQEEIDRLRAISK